MSINVIPVSSLQSFDHFIFPEQNPVNQDYFRTQVASFSNTLTDYGKKFMEASKAIYEEINDSNAIRLAKAALKHVVNPIHPNQIVDLTTIEEMQCAQPMMQRFIMADIATRQMYHRNLIDGYSDTYVDNAPGKVGLEHYDYRRVIEDIIMDGEDADGNYEWGVHVFGEDIDPEDKVLTLDEKVIILRIWERLGASMMSGKEDPTNPWGGKIAG